MRHELRGGAFTHTIPATRLIERGGVVRTTTAIIKLTRAKALWLSSTAARSIATHPDVDERGDAIVDEFINWTQRHGLLDRRATLRNEILASEVLASHEMNAKIASFDRHDRKARFAAS